MSNMNTCLLCGKQIPEESNFCPPCQERFRENKSRLLAILTDRVQRGDVYFADLEPTVGSETGGVRPVVILQNNDGNSYGPTVIAAVTTRARKQPNPSHVFLGAESGGLTADTTILLEQIRTLDRQRLRQYLGHIDDDVMNRINLAAIHSLGLVEYTKKQG